MASGLRDALSITNFLVSRPELAAFKSLIAIFLMMFRFFGEFENVKFG